MLHGWLVKPLPVGGACPERRLLAAIILQAVEDARRGNAEAADWLQEVGGHWCAKIGVELPVYDWSDAGGRLKAAQRVTGSASPEYWRAQRVRLRDDPAHQERERARWARTNERRKAERAQARTQGVGA